MKDYLFRKEGMITGLNSWGRYISFLFHSFFIFSFFVVSFNQRMYQPGTDSVFLNKKGSEVAAITRTTILNHLALNLEMQHLLTSVLVKNEIMSSAISFLIRRASLSPRFNQRGFFWQIVFGLFITQVAKFLEPHMQVLLNLLCKSST